MARTVFWLAGSLALVAGLFLWSLWAFSAFPLGLADAAPLWTGGARSTMTEIIARVRLPRAMVCVLIGAMMGLTGGLMQGVTRNRLASPSLLGVTGGASLGLAIVSSGLAGASVPGPVAATLGGAAAWTLVMLLGSAFSAEASRIRLVLAGMTMAALCAGLTRLVVLLAEERALGVLNWLAGSLANTGFGDVRLLAPVLLAAGLAAGAFAKPLNLIALGDEAALALGVRIGRLRALVFLLGCVMTGATVAVAGPIAFLGLIAPNLAYALVGTDLRRALPLAALLGAALLLASDILSRAVAFPSETPAGAVTALIGAPAFLLLARRAA
ncbi:iron chelate uptake ABC transporter family permease subunit [Poseidonocella sp. HB161398]|uniref:iron chelate uptake ABC transporter family permease subunit n=1 Tax=Poseidonocella sp. HB161398 TaxID=2320855 RepID=UPI001F0FCE98|nr:iron chelate uptake ABC transporter family permease subunit [Poseidonocella sp. HB161398]